MEDKQGAQLYGPFTILDELLECMMRGDKLPINILHIAGSRFCSKTFSVEHMSIKAMLAMRGIGVMAVRNEVGMAEELFTEYREMAADDFGNMFKVNLSKRTLEYGTNKLTVKGVNNGKVDNNGIKKPGLSKYREAKYIIMHNEEAYEIEPKQKRDIKQSLRSNKDTQILEINTLNPASLGNEYIAYLNQHFKFNEKELRANGYQWSGIIEIKKAVPKDKENPTGYIINREAFLYVNWRCVRHVLSEDIIRDILSTWDKDPSRAKTIDLGMPGDISGTIFGNILHHVLNAYDERHEAYRFGIDYGWGTSGNRSPTVCMAVGISPSGSGISCYGRYDHDNGVEYISQNEQVDRLLHWMNENRTEAIRRGLISRYDDIQCRVDNAHIGIIAMLQNAVVKKRWDWLHILPCDTKSALTKISQIEILKMIICNGLFKISEQDDNKTRVELGMITWENEKEDKMDHTHSHFFDALIYAVGAQDLIRFKDRDPIYFVGDMKGGKHV